MNSLNPSFHDGNLLGIQLAAGEAALSLKRVNGENYELTLNSLEALQMDDFREGNIIFEIEIINGRAPSAEALERLFVSPHPGAAAKYHDTHAQFLSSKVAKVEAGEATVIRITSSYGADIVAYCASATLRALGNGDS
jgi:hypothetical protein